MNKECKVTSNGRPITLDPTKKVPNSGSKIYNPALDRAEKILELLKKNRDN